MAAEGTLAPGRDGSVVLDLGGGRGAVVLLVPEELDGQEIEITNSDQPGFRTHTAVRERQLPDGSVWAAVFPSLSGGSYTLWDPGSGAPVATLAVTGGQVTTASWPTRHTAGRHLVV